MTWFFGMSAERTPNFKAYCFWNAKLRVLFIVVICFSTDWHARTSQNTFKPNCGQVLGRKFQYFDLYYIQQKITNVTNFRGIILIQNALASSTFSMLIVR